MLIDFKWIVIGYDGGLMNTVMTFRLFSAKFEAAVPIEAQVPLSQPPGNQFCNYFLQLLHC